MAGARLGLPVIRAPVGATVAGGMSRPPSSSSVGACTPPGVGGAQGVLSAQLVDRAQIDAGLLDVAIPQGVVVLRDADREGSGPLQAQLVQARGGGEGQLVIDRPVPHHRRRQHRVGDLGVGVGGGVHLVVAIFQPDPDGVGRADLEQVFDADDRDVVEVAATGRQGVQVVPIALDLDQAKAGLGAERGLDRVGLDAVLGVGEGRDDLGPGAVRHRALDPELALGGQ